MCSSLDPPRDPLSSFQAQNARRQGGDTGGGGLWSSLFATLETTKFNWDGVPACVERDHERHQKKT